MKRALEICSDVGGQVSSEAATTRDDREVTRQGAAGAWRKAFFGSTLLAGCINSRGGHHRNLRKPQSPGTVLRSFIAAFAKV